MLLLTLATALAWQPTADEEALVRALSTRHGAPPCSELANLSATPADSLEHIVDHVEMPPWVPMHAAACLIEEHFDAKSEVIARWVREPNKKGLAKLVFNRLHQIEPSDARSLVDTARSGPYAQHLNAALVRSPSAEVRALAD